MVFGNGVKNIQASAYNGVRTVYDTALTKYLSHNSALKNFTKQARRSLKLERKKNIRGSFATCNCSSSST